MRRDTGSCRDALRPARIPGWPWPLIAAYVGLVLVCAALALTAVWVV